MSESPRQGRRAGFRSHLLALLLALAVVALAARSDAAEAAGPPQILASWVTDVTASSANLRAEINPNEFPTTYLFEYITISAYEANLGASPPRDGFAGAARIPAAGQGIGAGDQPLVLTQHLSGLAPETEYRYRPVATNAGGLSQGPEHGLGTQASTSTFTLPDGRGWEMVSPVDKNGGAIEYVGTTESRVFQASADGAAVTFGSVSAFGSPQGAPPVSQYLSRRGSTGWATENLTIPLVAGSYGDQPSASPYRLFSPDLARGLVRNGERCRGSGGECPVANPPLPGSGAPAGYVNYYLRDNLTGAFAALMSTSDAAGLEVPPDKFDLDFVAASPELQHVLLSTCAALTPEAVEVPAGPEACDPNSQNLYEWSGAGLRLVNLLPGETVGTPGAEVAAQGRSVSADGSRVFWVGGDGNLYLREGQQTIQVDAAAGGGGVFQTASLDGARAFFTKAGHLYSYSAATKTVTDLTPGGGVEGVLGASDDGAYVYYLTGDGLELRHGSTTTEVAAAADSSNYPPSTGTARVSPDGTHVAFLSTASLTGYDNVGYSEVYLYGPRPGGGPPALLCVSCNPTGERPRGASTVPGAIANGTGFGATAVYKPRALSADGRRVFFDSADAIAVQDTDARSDVYQWEAEGTGSCRRRAGCIDLISSGRSSDGSSFVDASEDGSDVFFLTDGSLVPEDPGSIDLYDAREDGGFPSPPSAIPCEGDACQILPSTPEDPTPGTLVPNAGNPPAVKKPSKKKRRKRHSKRRGHRHHRHGATRRVRGGSR